MARNTKFRDVNLLLSYYKKPVKIKKKKTSPILVIIPILLMGILSLSFYYYYSKNNDIENEILQIEEFLNNNDNVKSSEDYKKTIEDLSRINTEITELNSKYEIMNNKSRIKKSVIDTIQQNLYQTSYIKGIFYDKNTANIQLQIASKNPLDVNFTVKKLENNGLFLNVNYIGYTYNNADNSFEYSVNCVLK